MLRRLELAGISAAVSLAALASISGLASGADRPVTGDWDGNNTTTIGIVRPEAGNWRWLLRNSNSEGTASADFLFGSAK
jgi:hypothetical protein